MKKLLLIASLAAFVAITGSAVGDTAPHTDAVGQYGCCCPWSEAMGLCPGDLVAFLAAWDDACIVLDAEGEVVGFCRDDPDGAYPFRGMSWPEIAAYISDVYGSEPTVGGLIDYFCGYDRVSAP